MVEAPTQEQADEVAARLAEVVAAVALTATSPSGWRRVDGRSASAGTLGAMCGIVGYVGPQDARDVVLDGLRRLEYRGYDSAGVAVVADGAAEHRRRRPASWPTWRRCSPTQPAARRPTHRHRAHPLGHPRRPDRPQRAPAPVRRRPGRGDPQRDHRELRRAARRARGRRRRVHLATPTPRSPRTCSPPRYARGAGGRPRPAGRGDARGLPPARGRVHPASPSTPTSPTPWSAPAATRPLVVGRRRRRELPGQRRLRVHRAHPRGASSSARTRSSLITAATARRSPTSTATPAEPARTSTSTGTPPPPRRAATTTSCSRRSPSSRRRSPTPCSAGSAATGELVLDEVRLTDQDLRDVDKVFIVACGTAYHAGLIAKYAIEHWTRIPCRGRAGQRVPLPRPGARPVHAGRRRSPSPARRWTR